MNKILSIKFWLSACTILCIIVTLFFVKNSYGHASHSDFSSGEVIKEFNDYSRKFIKIDQGYFVVQDFYGKERGEPASNPYRIKNKEDLLKDYRDQASFNFYGAESDFVKYNKEQTSIDGLYVRYLKGGKSEYMNFKNGVKYGRAFETKKNGYASRFCHFKNGKVNGKCFEFRGNGKIFFETFFIENVLQYLTIWFYNGLKYWSVNLKNGEMINETYWYASGQIRVKIFKDNGQEKWFSWHENGQPSSEVTIDNNGVMKCTEFSETGAALYKDAVDDPTNDYICTEGVRFRYYYYMNFIGDDFTGDASMPPDEITANPQTSTCCSELNDSDTGYFSGEVIAEFDGYSRRFIQKDGGYFVVEDFYNGKTEPSELGKPVSSPYRIKNKSDLLKQYGEQTSIEGLYVRYSINGKSEYMNFKNGVKDGSVFRL